MHYYQVLAQRKRGSHVPTGQFDHRNEIAQYLSDSRLSELAGRLIFAERPDLLSGRDRAVWERWLTDRLLSEDPNVPWMTIPKALQETDDLLASGEVAEAEFLLEVKSFLEEMADLYTSA